MKIRRFFESIEEDLDLIRESFAYLEDSGHAEHVECSLLDLTKDFRVLKKAYPDLSPDSFGNTQIICCFVRYNPEMFSMSKTPWGTIRGVLDSGINRCKKLNFKLVDTAIFQNYPPDNLDYISVRIYFKRN